MLADLLSLLREWIAQGGSSTAVAVMLFLAVVMLELLYLAFVSLGVLRFWVRRHRDAQLAELFPMVSCVITCYSEGRDVQRTILSLLDQDYAGRIEILPVVDGAYQNKATLSAAKEMAFYLPRFSRRALHVVPKWIRGGRASSLNAGLALAQGAIVMALDGDTSFDRDMVRRAVARFRDPGIVAVAGTLRVRNVRRNLLTRLQALDYLLFRQFVRTGLGEFNIVNNIPGAHGIFRAAFLRVVGGWDTGSAEDVDLALRIKKYFHRRPDLRIASDPHVISHTDVPERWGDFLRQRLRWEGDPAYLYLRKHLNSLSPAIMGWRNFLFCMWYGLTFQITMPLLLILSLLYLLLFTTMEIGSLILLLAYGLYLAIAAMLYVLHLLLVSERRREDMRLFWLLPIYPVFVLLVRIWSAFAVCHNLLLRSHLDSSMAPWWVLRKGKF